MSKSVSSRAKRLDDINGAKRCQTRYHTKTETMQKEI